MTDSIDPAEPPKSQAAAHADDRLRQPKGRQRRQQIIDTAVSLLAEKGFRGTSIGELAERVGMTHPGLLYYFGNKDRLLLEVVTERERIERAAIYDSLDIRAASLTRIPEIAGLISATRELARLYVVLAPENLDPGDPLHGFFVDRYEQARRLAAAAVTGDKRRGTVRTDVDTAQIAREVVATIMGLEMQWLMDSERIDYLAAVQAYATGLCARLAP